MAKRKNTSVESSTRKRKKPAASPTPEPAAKSTSAPMEYDQIFHIYRLKGVKDLIGNAKLYDVTFHIGAKQKVFQANRFPLISICKKFEELIDFPVGSEGHPIVLSDPAYTVKGFRAILKFAYGHDPIINAENACDVANLAKHLGITILEKKVMGYIKKILDETDEKLMKYLELGTTFNNDAIIKLCFDSLQARGGIPQFLASPAFSSLNANLLNQFLKLDSLPVQEPTVWDTCLKWAEFQSEKNGTEVKNELKKVYHNVRFPLCDPGFFSTKVVPQGILSQEENMKVFMYLCNKQGDGDTSPFLKTPRVLWDNTTIERFTKAPGSEWFHLENFVDGIGFEVSRKVQLLGVGTLLGEGSNKCHLKIFKGCGEDRKQVAKLRQTVKSSEKSSTPHKLMLNDPIILDAEEPYEIELSQIGPVSLRGNAGLSEVFHDHNGISACFTFSRMKHTSNGETNETSVKKGNIPTLYVRVTSDM